MQASEACQLKLIFLSDAKLLRAAQFNHGLKGLCKNIKSNRASKIHSFTLLYIKSFLYFLQHINKFWRNILKNILNYFLILFFIFTICKLKAEDEAELIFDDSQTAIVNITIDSLALEWIYTYDNRKSDSLHLASIRFENKWIQETVDSVGFRLRGNTSRDSQKKSFKISFNTFLPGFEFYGLDKMNLNGEHNDPSIVRSKLCWDIFQDIGMTASRAAYAAVYINGEYYGLYIIVEHIDNEFIKSRFTDPSGNLWKCLWPADLTYKGDTPEHYHPENYIPFCGETKPYELKTNKVEYDYSQLARLIRIINKTPDNHSEDSLSTILAVPEFLKYLAVNVLTGSWDDHWYLKNNYYLYYEPAEDIFHWIPYDYDNSFSIDWFNIDWSTINIYQFGPTNAAERPLAARIMNTPRYRNLYTHFLKLYADNILGTTEWSDRLDSIKAMISPWAAADQWRTLDYGFTMDDFNNSYSASYYFDSHVKRGIREFADRRVNSINSQIEWQTSGPIIYNLDYHPKNPGPSDSIYVDAAIFSPQEISEAQIAFQPGTLTVINYYPLNFNPVPDTKTAEEADRWSGTIPPLGSFGTGRFQITAKDSDGRTHFYPRTDVVELAVPQADSGSIVINEFLARNVSSNSDDNGEYDDWLELYNPSDAEINLAGMYLSDSRDNLTRWQFSQETVLNPGEFILVWCDGDTAQTGLHTNFKLDGDGESIFFTAADGISIIDSISFGEQENNISQGRYPDGSVNWQKMAPTPGYGNAGTNIENDILPESFTLSVYPNPFNPSTVISYQLSVISKIDISVFDLLGRKIKTLIKSSQPAGRHEINWYGKNDMAQAVSTGVYLLRFKSGNFVQTKKLVLLK